MSIAEIKRRQSLDANILASEIRRFTYMAAIFGTFALGLTCMGWLMPGRNSQAFNEGMLLMMRSSMPGSFALYALLSGFYLRRMQKRGGQLQSWFQYFSSFFEITLLTGGIIASSAMQGQRLAILLTPFPFAYFIFIIFSILRLRPTLCVFTGIVSGLEYLASYCYFYNAEQVSDVGTAFLYIAPPHLMRVLVFVCAGVLAGYVTKQISRNLAVSFEKAHEAERVTQMFGRYVSDRVAEKLLSAGDIEDERPEATDVTVLFFDIRNFTGVSERLPAEITFAELNRFLTRAADIVGENGGFINKLLGDGFLAVFGAPLHDPKHANGAVNAARLLGREFDKMKSAGFIFRDFGIGLHTGTALVGSLGSDARREYTVIGDTVNLAARIEAMNKDLKTRILLSEATLLASGVPGVIRISELPVRGRQVAVTLFELPV